MSNTVHVNGWSLAVSGDGEPMVRDLDLAERLGFERPRDIRKLITRLLRDGFLNDSEVRATVAQTSKVGGRPGTEYHLTETACFLVTMKSETAIANAVCRQLVEVFQAYRSGQLVAQSRASQLDVLHAISGGGEVRDNPAIAAHIKKQLGAIATNAGRHWQHAHGRLRKFWRVPSYQCLRLNLLPYVDDWLTNEVTAALRTSPAIRALPQTTQTTIFDLIEGKR
ncbi:MAG: hypothetical protein ACPGZP_11500 [Panacagrimonas sp.]